MDDCIIRTYKYRLRTTARDRRRLERRKQEYRDLYNAVVQERESHFRAIKRNGSRDGVSDPLWIYSMPERAPSCIGHTKELTTFRKEILPDCPLQLARGAIAHAHRTFDAFFKRTKAGEKTHRPFYMSRRRLSTLEFRECPGMRIRDGHVQAKGIGSLKMDLHRPLPDDGKLVTWKLVEDCDIWYVCLTYKLPVPSHRRPRGRSVGLDMGLQYLAMDDSGTPVTNPKFHAKSASALRRVQRKLRYKRSKSGHPKRQMSRRGGNSRAKVVKRLRRLHRRVANQRLTYARQTAARLVQGNDLIVVENLNIRGLAKSRLAKAVTDAGWGVLVGAIENAAEGRCTVVKVDPRRTSQECPDCGAINKKPLKQRWHKCSCGLEMERDHASAIVIKRRGCLDPRVASTCSRGERATGNTEPETAAVPGFASGPILGACEAAIVDSSDSTSRIWGGDGIATSRSPSWSPPPATNRDSRRAETVLVSIVGNK